MAASPENTSMALFCDFENVALGVRDAKYEKFDIKLVLERLLLKGSIVVKKAYCDWERYKGFKATMHEANFELIEIPHVRQSGKNSADIRLVVDALDLCYTKSHVNTFVIISGDSDFSPLVSKLRENAKQVIGVGVKQSTSDLLIANCDEFIFYDDLVRETQRNARREPKDATPARRSDDDKPRREDAEARRAKGIGIAVETFDALIAEKGDTGKIWASVVKEAIKRRRPDFSETRYGFRSFGALLEEAHSRGLLEFGRDEKSGAYVYRSASAQAEPAVIEAPAEIEAAPSEAAAPETRHQDAKPREGKSEGRRKRGEARKAGRPQAEVVPAEPQAEAAPEPSAIEAPAVRPVSVAETPPPIPEPAAPEPAVSEASPAPVEGGPRRKRGAKAARPAPAAQEAGVAPPPSDAAPESEPKPKPRRSRAKAAAPAPAPEAPESSPSETAKPARRRRARKTEE